MLAILYLFFDDLRLSILGLIGLYPYYLWIVRLKIKDRKNQLRREFKECLGILSTYLVSGYSPEKAIGEARNQIVHLQGKDSLMLEEFNRLTHGLEMGMPLEKLLQDFAYRSHQGDIQLFVKIFCIGRQLGGNLNQILISSILQIQGKIKIQEEIGATIAQKNLERKIMNYIPLAIIAYIRVFSGDLLKGTYHTPTGYILMSISLVVYGACILWGYRLTQIEI